MTLVAYDQNSQREICSLLGIEGTANHITLLFKLAEHYQLDVLTKEITLIPKKGPFIGVWGRLHIAHRSGHLDGLELDDEWETDKHYCVRSIVWRNDMRHPAAKVVGRVGKHEGSTKDGVFTPKDWPLEIARARGLRAGLGFAFSIHDSFDTDNDGDDWAPPPDERLSNGSVDVATGEIIDAAGPAEEVRQGEPAAAPKRRRTNKPTAAETPGAGASTGEVHVESERLPGVGQDNDATPGSDPAPTPDIEPPTIVVGGHTLAQKIAMAARDADIDDDPTRHDVIRAASRGVYQRGSDIPEDGYDQDIVDRIFDAFAGLADGTVQLRYDPDGTPKLYKTRRT